MSEILPGDPLGIIESILARELKKLEDASKLPHCLSREQVDSLATLARVYRQNPERPPPAQKDPLEGLSPADLLAALRPAP